MKKSELKQIIREVIDAQDMDVDPDKFVLSIELGNEAANLETVPNMLREVAKKIDQGKESGKIVDTNGNVVGEFEFTVTPVRPVPMRRRSNPISGDSPSAPKHGW